MPARQLCPGHRRRRLRRFPGDPIDLTAYVTAPCGLLNGPQLTTFFITHGGAAAPAGKTTECRWTPSDTAVVTFHASVEVGAGGLEAVYGRRATLPAFEPTSVHSYPAVHTDIGAGHCAVRIGVAPETVLTAAIDVPAPKLTAYTYDDPCTEAVHFAGVIIGYQGHRAP